MTFRRRSNLLAGAAVLPVLLALSPVLCAQGPIPDAPSSSIEPASHVAAPSLRAETTHKFWDNQNRALFAGVVLSSAADFAVTRANLQSGGRELNPLVRIFGRSTAGLAVNFAGETAGVIGLSYFFHKTNHHRLERLTSMINIGASVGAVSYGLARR